VHVIEIILIFSDTIKFHKTDGCLFSLAVLVGASCVPSYWSDTIEYTCREIKKLMKGKALRKHSLHEKTAASVLLKLFISSNE